MYYRSFGEKKLKHIFLTTTEMKKATGRVQLMQNQQTIVRDKMIKPWPNMGRKDFALRHEKTYLTYLYLCHLQRGTSNLLGGLKRCFEAFVSSRNSLIITFGPLSRLGAIPATVRQEDNG